MKCPKCGHEHPPAKRDAGTAFRSAIADRLVEYGYQRGMSPEKHGALLAVQKVIGIRFGIGYRSGGGMPEDDATIGLVGLNTILPTRKGGPS